MTNQEIDNYLYKYMEVIRDSVPSTPGALIGIAVMLAEIAKRLPETKE